MSEREIKLDWHRVADVDELPEGRVKTVTAGTHSMALTHILTSLPLLPRSRDSAKRFCTAQNTLN
jgi:hypothetical protein